MSMGKRERDRMEERYRVLLAMRDAAQRLVDSANKAIEMEIYGSPRVIEERLPGGGYTYDIAAPFQVKIRHYNELLASHGIIAKAEG